MTGLFGGVAARTTIRSAHASLAGLMSAVGVTGLAAAADRPGLLAAMDQHAAAVRDSLRADTRPLSRVVLAGYAEGVRDAAFEHGWRVPEGLLDFAAPDWVLTRLLAVCMLVDGMPDGH